MNARRMLVLLTLATFSARGQTPAQHKEAWPKPEVVVAPVYPINALVRRVEGEVTVNTDIDRYGNVTRAEAVDGPCPHRAAPGGMKQAACDLAHEAEIHRSLAEKRRNESFDKSLSEEERGTKWKESTTEDWLAAQLELYASAERAAHQWVFQSMRPATPPGHHVVNLAFRFVSGKEASIQVVDPWTIVVTGTTYPAGSD